MIIRVPASSANLGAGFDCFGIAWDIYNEIEFEIKGSGLEISGCEAEFCNEDNLAYVAFRKTLEYAGRECGPLSICFGKTEIPVSRGLGSSAALTSAGVVAADALYRLNLSADEKLHIASIIEGHPDNVAPALFGGFTVSVSDGEVPVSRSFPISNALHFAVLIPPFRLSTSMSRSVLPDKPDRGDAVFNIGRAALFTKALGEGDTGLLKVSMQDRIHQPYRLPLIEGWEKAKKAAEDCGAIGFCISGAGSTMLAIGENEAMSARLADCIASELPGWRVRTVKPDYIGARIL